MEHEHFDTLARRVGTNPRGSRRAALAALLGAALLGHDPGAILAKKRKPQRKTTATATMTATAADACFPNTSCTPGKGRNTSGCDFAHSTAFKNRVVRGANLSNSNYFGADLTGADFRGANLSGSCLVGADLTGARLGASVNLHQAVFCNTTMPDGTIDNSGCEGATPCCHLREQDCPDASFDCMIVDRNGLCGVTVGSLRTGTCWNFPTCCPCQHSQDQAYWNALCEQTFSDCAGRCQAEFEGENACHEGFICP